jgi:hypothetical protein
VTERLRQELDDATAELKEHMASWAYAFAHAGGPNGGADHPVHRRTRERTSELQRRVKDLKSRLAEHEL